MAEAAERKPMQSVRKRGAKPRVRAAIGIELGGLSGQTGAGESRVETVMKAAKRSGLLGERSGRIAGRVSPALVRRAKDRTGIKTDSDLIVFALANVALEDNFAETFKDIRGTVDPGLKLGF